MINGKMSEERNFGDSKNELNPLPSTPEPKVGSRLKHSRMVAGLSMRSVAGLAGVSEGYISKIENDKVQPSFATLHRIANAVGTNIGALFSKPEQNGKLVTIITASERTVMNFGSSHSGDGIRLERLCPTHLGSLLQANIHVVEPGGGSEEAIVHPGQEMGMVLEGTLDLYVGNEVHKLNEGDAFSFESEHEHRYRNTGDRVTRVIWINSPPTF